MGIGKTIDEHIPNTSVDKILSTGNAVTGLILNGLGFVNKRLYLVSRFFENKPIYKLLNVKYLESSHFNEDTLGRSLDAIYEFGVSEMYAILSSQVITYLSSEYVLKAVKDLIIDIDKEKFKPLTNYTKYQYQEVTSDYGEVAQRWVVLKSEDKFTRDLKNLDKTVYKVYLEAKKAHKKLLKQTFETEAEALKAVGLADNKLKFNTLENICVVEQYKYSRSGKPAKGQQPDKKYFTLTADLEKDTDEYEAEKDKLGYFILTTNKNR